jgi:magnesium transporter
MQEIKDAEGANVISPDLAGHHPADAAALLARLGREPAARALEVVGPDAAAAILIEMHPAAAAPVVSAMPPDMAAAVLAEMPPDDRVDVLGYVPDEVHDRLVGALGAETAAEVSRLESYPEDSAGGIMTTDVVSLPETMTAEEAASELRRLSQEVEQVFYVYVTDPSGGLTGVLSMRDLVLAPPDRPLAVLKHPNVVTVPAEMDQEEVARQLRRHGFLALPVVDAGGKLLGIITVDDVADVTEEEATEDIQKIGGTEALHAPYHDVGVVGMIRKRGGWLSALFLGEMLTATAMGFFESEIERAAMVALFVPLVISSGGNSGSQATTIIIRSLALGEVTLSDWWRICRKELSTGMLLGFFLGLLGAVRVVLWYYLGWHAYGGHPFLMAATVWVSLAGVVTFGSAAGSMLPLVLSRVGMDPATASAPFVATLVDVTGLVIYFMVAIAILSGTVL